MLVWTLMTIDATAIKVIVILMLCIWQHTSDNRTLFVFEKWLDENALKSFESIINKLKALVQGVRVTFPTSQDKEIYYQINKPMMESLY
jgi:hypothetical protein